MRQPAPGRGRDAVHTHLVHLLLVEHLCLRRVEMLHRVGIRIPGPGGHAPHEGGGVDLRSRT